MRIIVTGLVALYPVGGVAWDYFSYIIGLAKLGHDVYYHEDTWCWPYHPLQKQYVSEGNYSAQYIKYFFQLYAPELNDHWHYFHLHETSFGMSKSAFDEVAKTADLFLNISGACPIPENLSNHCVKIFLDTDPGYNQIVFSEKFSWSENVERWCQNLLQHDRYFTYGENINSHDCLIPKLGLDWKTTRMPIVMDLWNSISKINLSQPKNWTTIMSWNSFKGKLVYQGVEYKSKDAEFEKIIKLPKQINSSFLIAVGGITTSLKWFEKNNWTIISRFLSSMKKNQKFKQLADNEWQVIDAPSNTLTPDQYQNFIGNSRGEFSIAKNIYVAMKTGWFSCRSACYLALGKPVVVQDTGFSSILPTGEGLLSFNNLQEAIYGIEQVEANYTKHSRKASQIAQEYFDCNIVLKDLLENV